jgi:hypothetical protein
MVQISASHVYTKSNQIKPNQTHLTHLSPYFNLFKPAVRPKMDRKIKSKLDPPLRAKSESCSIRRLCGPQSSLLHEVLLARVPGLLARGTSEGRR